MPVTFYRIRVAAVRSTSILLPLTFPRYSPASSSTIGAIARQGPHHAAQKSTSTGLSDFSTSESKFASVTSTVPLLAILPPGFQFREQPAAQAADYTS